MEDTATNVPNDQKGNASMEEQEEVSMDDLIEDLFRDRTWKYTLLLMSLSFLWLAVPFQLYITAFAGTTPTSRDSWTCVSQKCKDLVTDTPFLNETFPCQLTEIKNGVRVPMLRNEDIKWSLYHSSFAVELDMYCDIGDSRTKKTFITSIFFVGALTGTLGGGYLNDNIGRKETSIFGFMILVISLLCGAFCHDYLFLSFIRFFQGIGTYVLVNGSSILCLELTPREFRNYVPGAISLCFALGYYIAIGLHYLIPDWNLKFLGAAMAVVITSFPVLLCAESPRYHLINSDFESTRKSLKALASLTTSEMDIDKLDLNNYLTSSAKTREQSLKQQLKDLFDYPALLGETLIQILLWFCVGVFYHGINLEWEAILPNIYLGFTISGLGELFTAFVTMPLLNRSGRRRAHIIGYFGTMFLCLIAIPDVQIGGQWTLKSVSCALSIVFVYGCFSGLYLWTGELAPTSHRGLVFCVCSGASAVGSFVGPYIFGRLTPVSTGILACLAALCTAGCFLLVETGDKSTCLTGQDVSARRKTFFRYC